MQRNKGAFTALLLAGAAYLFKNRKQLGDKLKGLTGSAQRQLPEPTTRQTTSEPNAYTGDTVRM